MLNQSNNINRRVEACSKILLPFYIDPTANLFKQMTLVFTFLFLGILACPAYGQINKKAVKALIKRVVPKHYSKFEIEYIPKIEGNDLFVIKSKKNKIILEGNNGISMASALNYYLEHFCNVQYSSWYNGGTELKFPEKLPDVPKKIKKLSPYQYRYYLNYVTFDYSLLWWDWKRWQKEIDWMALHGINMPLALTGQNAVWEKVFNSMGFTDQDLRKNFFTGPAFSAFNWFGLVDSLGGPLPQSWINAQKKLQKKILKRERSLGMTPVLPAFMGHVPPDFKAKFPDAQLQETSGWQGFPKTKRLSPDDPLFKTIGSKFIREQRKLYGTNHLYAADPFIEVIPPSDNPGYLKKMSRTIYQSMADADPEALWVLEDWFLYYRSDFWKPAQTKAFLNAVGNDQMIILDLWSEVHPLWQKEHAFYGKPWIWNMVHDFGGRRSLFGHMKTVASQPAVTLNDSFLGNMAGIGLTMEGIEQNEVMYDLLLANTWRSKPIDVDSWLRKYIMGRYGEYNEYAEKAWKVLKETAYSGREYRSVITVAPHLNKPPVSLHWPVKTPYDPENLLPAWKQMIEAADDLKKSEAFQYDLVDLSRQVLDNYAITLYQRYVKSYRREHSKKYKEYASKFLNLIDNIDQLLATRKEFLLGTWLKNAKSWGTNKAEKELYEQNAKNLVTVWGSPETSFALRDYSSRNWAGLYRGFYKIRWKKFFNYAENCKNKKEKIDEKSFNNKLKKWEWKWVNSKKSYATQPKGDPIKTAKKMFEKYYGVIIKLYH